MRKIFVFQVAVLVLCLAMSGLAFAGDGGFYGSLKGGGSFLDATKSASTNATVTSSSSKFETDESLALGVAIGYDWMANDVPVPRTELEYMYHSDFKYEYADSNSTLTNDIGLQTVMLNVYWDFHNETAFTPYVNAGAGVAWVKESFSTGVGASAVTLTSPEDKTNTNFAWNVGAGVGWGITDSLTLDLAYRYNHYGDGEEVTATSTTKTVTSQVKDISTHDVLLGLRLDF